MPLFPEVSALVIYSADRGAGASIAQELANESRFPVVTRAAADDPMLHFRSMVTTRSHIGEPVIPRKDDDRAPPADDGKGEGGGPTGRGDNHNQLPGSGGGSGGGSPERGKGGPPAEDNQLGPPHGGSGSGGSGGGSPGRSEGGGPPAGRDMQPSDGGGGSGASQSGGPPGGGGNQQPGGDMGGGNGGPPGGENPPDHRDDPDIDGWASPLHWTQLVVKLQLTDLVDLEICCETQFTTHGPRTRFYPPGEERKDIMVVTEVKIDFPPDHVSLGKSFAVLGLQADRSGAMFKPTNLDAGFNPPNKTFKYVSGQSTQAGVGLNVGVPPSAILNASYTISKTLEAQDDKPMPPVKVTCKRGKPLAEEPAGTSYRSYGYSYVAQPHLETPSSLVVRFAFGTDCHDHDTENNPAASPQILSVNRHQIFVWIYNPRAKIQIQGVILLLSAIVPDIRNQRKMVWSQTLKLDPGTGQLMERPRTDHDRLHGGSLSSAMVTLPKVGGGFLEKIKEGAKSVAKIFSTTPCPMSLVPQEIESVGWDNRRNDWRDPIYPALDKKFQSLEDPSLRSVYRIIPANQADPQPL
ncbi:hypothetical protein DFH06DRAFT_1204101 [Mycena polygramma]|nr:hypothetical protein DFH06DRAFT_1204101 [Mycena polygramma]